MNRFCKKKASPCQICRDCEDEDDVGEGEGEGLRVELVIELSSVGSSVSSVTAI